MITGIQKIVTSVKKKHRVGTFEWDNPGKLLIKTKTENNNMYKLIYTYKAVHLRKLIQ